MGFLEILINGIERGSIYAIIALGYTMVYGIAKMLNFAHGDVIMIGGYASYCAAAYMNWGILPSILLSVVVCTVLGIVIEGAAYKPLRGAPSLAVLITAIGVSYLLQNAAQLIWSSNPKNYPEFLNIPGFELWIGSLRVPSATIITVACCLAVMIGLILFVNHTKMGKAMRAVSEDKGAACLMGINVNRTISLTFAIGSGLAALAGVLYCGTYYELTPTTGAMPGIKAFTAAVFGGIGSIPGAMVGGLLMGVIEKFAESAVGDLSDAVVFAVLIVILLVKPTGLFGKKITEKV